MKPLVHARISVRRFGGKVDDYLPIHNYIDQTKAHVPDARHRIILHNSFGIYLCEQQFGSYLTLENGHTVSVRDVAEQHVLDDLGFIPTLVEILDKAKLPAEIKSGKLAQAFVIVD